MKRAHHNLIERCKRRLRKRLTPTPRPANTHPVLSSPNIVHDIAERTRAIARGGIGLMHTLVDRVGLAKAIDTQVRVLKAHLPYFESDHILSIAYNVMTGGTCLSDIDRLRTDEALLDALGAQRLPDPTTAGDFVRRFDERAVVTLQDAINDTRQKIWAATCPAFRREAILDVDGTIAPTQGLCKQGQDMSYKGIWGHAPLLLTLASTKEVLYLVNRSGNHNASFEAATWINRALGWLPPTFEQVWIRGDCDFALTEQFADWDSNHVRFVFGYKGHATVVARAEALEPDAWARLPRPIRPQPQKPVRQRPPNVRTSIVKKRLYKTIRLLGEQVAEFAYTPTARTNAYRIVGLRKHLSIERGEHVLEKQTRYFFHITNDHSKSKEQIVAFANARCNQENVIAQLKSGIDALRQPTRDLVANWAYMVCAALAWNLKAWMGLMASSAVTRRDILRMEFKRFIASYIMIPCQIVRTARQVVYRVLGYRSKLRPLLTSFDRIKHFSSA